MSIAAELTKKLYTALGHDLSNQIMALSENLRLLHRYQTNSIEQVRAQYNPEQDLIRDEISALGDDANDEYTDLMAELKASQDKEDQMIEQIEQTDQYSSTYQRPLQYFYYNSLLFLPNQLNV